MKYLSYIYCCIILTLFLAACGDSGPVSTDNGSINAPTTNTQPTPIAAITARGSFKEYPLPQTDSGMMRPAIDHEGRIWFGEMGHNYLAVFDPSTRTFQQMVPPRGQSGIMGILVAPDDTVWFAEQYTDYIGHYFPKTGQYQTYDLPSVTAPDPSDPAKTLTLPSAPNDLALDAQGNVWFTEINADALGKLDTYTGLTQQFPVSTDKNAHNLDPYGVTVDAHGMVWFTESANDHIGRLDPNSGKIQFYTMPGPTLPLMEISSGPHDTIWATSFSSGLLLCLNAVSGTFTPFYVPFTGNTAGGLYGLAISTDGEIWITIAAENKIARLDLAAHRFVDYAVPTEGSLPLGIVMGANHTLWFTEAGKDKIGMLKP